MKKIRTVLGLLKAQGARHFFIFAKFRLIMAGIRGLSRLVSFDPRKDPTQKQFDDFLAQVNGMKRPRILELGSRNISHRDLFTGDNEYVGFDINPGPGVDVVGDIHALSAHFPAGHFDAVYAISVFEHLAMPWKAAQEINRILKPGGVVFLFTHPAFPLHAEPWDFWRFSQWTFPVLFNSRSGYEIVECRQGLPCVILPLANSASTRGMHSQLSYMGVTLTARKTGEAEAGLAWDLKTSDYSGQVYPKEYSAPARFLEFLKEINPGRG